MLKWLWLSVVVIALDQASKAVAVATLTPGESLGVLPSFNLTLMYNTGAAFSFLSNADGWQRWLFAGIAVVVSVIIVGWLRKLHTGARWQAAALALILGGALGNLWDRLVLGHVVDFLDVYYGQAHWPAFNIADSAIVVGAGMLVIEALRGHRQEPPHE